MAPIQTRGRRPQGLIFYSTASVIALFTVYSVLRAGCSERSATTSTLHRRTLDSDPVNLECRLVHTATDQCAFIRANCPDEEAGLISYLQFYYCTLARVKPVAFIVLVIWISLLFSTIGIAASDFLCVNLSTIATLLGMSESLAGVTFLAFGNGSSDVFSTFAAMSSNSGSLAVGELMGAAGFITAVVAGSMAIVRPFRVARKSFVRDVAFFAVAASFSLVFLADGRLRMWECAAMIAFYVFYVAFVVAWHWWQQKRRRIRLAENAARLHHHIPEHQELDMPLLEEDDEDSRPASERPSIARVDSSISFPTISISDAPAWKVRDVDDDDDDDTRNRYLAELSSNMRISRPGRERRNTVTPIRPSLIGALEFRSVLSSLEKKSTTRPINLSKYSDDGLAGAARGHLSISHPDLAAHDVENGVGAGVRQPGQSHLRTVSANDIDRFDIDARRLSLPGGTPQTAIYHPDFLTAEDEHDHTHPPLSPLSTVSDPVSPTPRIHQNSPGAPGQNQFLAPPPMGTAVTPTRSEHAAPSPLTLGGSSHTSNTISPHIHGLPTLQIPSPAPRPIANEQFLSPSSLKPPSIRLPPPSMSPESSHHHLLLPDEECKSDVVRYAWWPYTYLPSPQVIFSTLFPTLYGWRKRGHADKLMGLVTAPTVFLLTVTLPVVDPTRDDVEPSDLSRHSPLDAHTVAAVLAPDTPDTFARDSSQHPHHPKPRRDSYLGYDATQPDGYMDTEKSWNRWLVILQCFTAPLFVVTILWANVEETDIKGLVRLLLGSLVFSLLCLLLLLATTTSTREPRYRPLFCFLGFAVAIAWISTIANEVVGVLKAIGVILDISDAILGLTVFAVGNSLGDLVADITVAKLGYPVMALSACFGGPMLNILLGIGIGGLYMTIHNATHHHQKHPGKPLKYKPYQLEVSTTLMISGVTLLVTLLGLLIVVPLNGWRMDRKIGIGLIVLWSLSTIANVMLEVLGYESQWNSSIV